jgi:osmoprotectant transport system ATP-binding protein
MFRLSHVVKTYDGTRALDDVTLDIAPGQTTVLIGPSGCGKSTLLRLLVGLIRPDSGRIEFDGRPLDARSLPAVRRRLGYVIQEGGLFPHLTARENITLMARHLRWPASRIATRVYELAALTRFPDEGFDRYPGELSGGQNQRVSLMRALMLDPQVLLLDEPLGALDPMIRFDLQEDLQRIFESLGKTVVLVTHDLAEAGFLGHNLVLLRKGHVVQHGDLRELMEAEADEFVGRFVQAQRSFRSGLDSEP